MTDPSLRGVGPSPTDPTAAPVRRRVPWRHPWVLHLRLGFNLVLSPIYLWGVWLAGGGLLDWRTWVGWVSLHVFLYGGTTAFNSSYDKDTGPIGGLRHPPPVDRGLLWWSLAVQAVGLPLAFLVGPPFLVAWIGLAVVAAAYSHPSVRLKARPTGALAAVALGQGGIGFLAGWWAVAERERGLAALGDVADPLVLIGAATASLVLVGLYVVTQAYQTVEDRERGDRTLAVVWGPRTALLRGLAASAVGVALMIAVVVDRLGLGWAVVAAAGAVAVGSIWWRWAATFDEAELDVNYRTAMRIAALGGGGLSAFLLVHLALR